MNCFALNRNTILNVPIHLIEFVFIRFFHSFNSTQNVTVTIATLSQIKQKIKTFSNSINLLFRFKKIVYVLCFQNDCVGKIFRRRLFIDFHLQKKRKNNSEKTALTIASNQTIISVKKTCISFTLNEHR